MKRTVWGRADSIWVQSPSYGLNCPRVFWRGGNFKLNIPFNQELRFVGIDEFKTWLGDVYSYFTEKGKEIWGEETFQEFRVVFNDIEVNMSPYILFCLKTYHSSLLRDATTLKNRLYILVQKEILLQLEIEE